MPRAPECAACGLLPGDTHSAMAAPLLRLPPGAATGAAATIASSSPSAGEAALGPGPTFDVAGAAPTSAAPESTATDARGEPVVMAVSAGPPRAGLDSPERAVLTDATLRPRPRAAAPPLSFSWPSFAKAGRRFLGFPLSTCAARAAAAIMTSSSSAKRCCQQATCERTFCSRTPPMSVLMPYTARDTYR
ncbi:hypothetical protein Vafri_274 [Volvox africanus]|nr:hypothetical protein Vafri_274 [Volvox africanus]